MYLQASKLKGNSAPGTKLKAPIGRRPHKRKSKAQSAVFNIEANALTAQESNPTLENASGAAVPPQNGLVSVDRLFSEISILDHFGISMSKESAQLYLLFVFFFVFFEKVT